MTNYVERKGGDGYWLSKIFVVISCKRSNIREIEIVELIQTTEGLAYVVRFYNEWKSLAETLVT